MIATVRWGLVWLLAAVLLAGCYELDPAVGPDVLSRPGPVPGLKTGRWLVWRPQLNDFDDDRPVYLRWDAARNSYLIVPEDAGGPAAAVRAQALEPPWWLLHYQALDTVDAATGKTADSAGGGSAGQSGNFLLLARVAEGGYVLEVPVVDDAAAPQAAQAAGAKLRGAVLSGDPAALRAFMAAMSGRLRQDLPCYAYVHTDHAEAFRKARR